VEHEDTQDQGHEKNRRCSSDKHEMKDQIRRLDMIEGGKHRPVKNTPKSELREGGELQGYYTFQLSFEILF
jgi:hypothetical protein